MRRVLGTIGALTMVALPACGDDGEQRLTEAEFRTQANAICKEATADLDEKAKAAFGDADELPPAADLMDFLNDDLIPNVEAQADDIDDLSPPESLEADVDALLESVRDAADGLKDVSEDEIEALFTSDEDPFADANSKSVDLGLDECAA